MNGSGSRTGTSSPDKVEIFNILLGIFSFFTGATYGSPSSPRLYRSYFRALSARIRSRFSFLLILYSRQCAAILADTRAARSGSQINRTSERETLNCLAIVR
jgi:hypothetical protein